MADQLLWRSRFGSGDYEVSAVEDAAKTAVFTIVTSTPNKPNRNGMLLDLMKNDAGSGMLFEHYANNPVVFFEHALYAAYLMPIGTSRDPKTGELKLSVTKTKAAAKVWFNETDLAQQAFQMVRSGNLQAASIGYIPDFTKTDRVIVEDQPELTRAYYHVHEFELVEWSIVGVPADPNALKKSSVGKHGLYDRKLYLAQRGW